MDNVQEILEAFGNGNAKKGLDFLTLCAGRLKHARTAHPKEEWGSMDHLDAYLALHGECGEVFNAMIQETPERVLDEILDVMAVATRIHNVEYGAEHE